VAREFNEWRAIQNSVGQRDLNFQFNQEFLFPRDLDKLPSNQDENPALVQQHKNF